MGVVVREKVKGSGEWWAFINHNGRRTSKKVGTRRNAEKVAEQEGVAKGGYRLAVNQGNDGGQVVDHIHMHLLGGRPLREMG